jgi:ABC-type branched-subunit amino acid transport system ATPase component
MPSGRMNASVRLISVKQSETVLEVANLSAGYGRVQVIRDAGLTVGAGEVVGLVGRNGAGKTTFISAVAGTIANANGLVRLGDRDISVLQASDRVKAGIALVPSGGRLFKSLTVSENLLIGLQHPSDRDLEPVFALFPELVPLQARYAGKLSGGERQMVAIGRAILLHPRLLLLDEPSEGLAPIVVLRLVDALKTLWGRGVAALVAEQNVKFTQLTCHRRYSIDKGYIEEAH